MQTNPQHGEEETQNQDVKVKNNESTTTETPDCRSGRPDLDFNGNHFTLMVSLKVSLKIIFEKSDVKKACRITKLAKI